MKKNSISCENIELKIMALTDNELPESEIELVKNHVESCETCRKKFNSLTKVKEITGQMKFKKLPEMYWDEYWRHVYNRMERGFSWIIISIGAIIIFTFAAWKAVSGLFNNQQMDPLLKIGIFVLVAGVVILFVSVFREKLMVKKVDKYREVER